MDSLIYWPLLELCLLLGVELAFFGRANTFQGGEVSKDFVSQHVYVPPCLEKLAGTLKNTGSATRFSPI